MQKTLLSPFEKGGFLHRGQGEAVWGEAINWLLLARDGKIGANFVVVLVSLVVAVVVYLLFRLSSLTGGCCKFVLIA